MTSGTSGPQNYRRAGQLAGEADNRLSRGEEESAARLGRRQRPTRRYRSQDGRPAALTLAT